eukprot:1700456-Pyramimonas_sp.AAC.1
MSASGRLGRGLVGAPSGPPLEAVLGHSLDVLGVQHSNNSRFPEGLGQSVPLEALLGILSGRFGGLLSRVEAVLS